MSGAFRLGPNQYGKAEVRIVKITRDTATHEIEDLNVTSQLRGDFGASHLTGDNRHVVATDTQKNTVYGLAREHGIGSPEAFLLRLGDHFTGAFDWVTGGRWEAESYAWARIAVDGEPHDHAFVREGQETRTAVVTKDGEETWVVAGLTGLVVLKSTGSEFHGFPRDRFTTLTETDDRILATAVTARWRYTDPEVDFNAPTRRSGSSSSRCSPRPTRSRCSRRSTRWAPRCSRPGPRSRRSASRCRTSTTSSSISARSGSTTRTRSSSPPTGPTG